MTSIMAGSKRAERVSSTRSTVVERDAKARRKSGAGASTTTSRTAVHGGVDNGSGGDGGALPLPHGSLSTRWPVDLDLGPVPDDQATPAFAARAAKKVSAAKVALRGRDEGLSLADWRRRAFASAPPPGLLSPAVDRGAAWPETLARVDARSMTREEFVARFERPRLPVVLTGLLDDDPAWRDTLDRLRPSSLLREWGEAKWRLGTDDKGKPVRLK